MRPSALLLAVCLLFAGCAPPPPPQMGLYNPYPPPPALRAEQQPEPPITSERLIWRPGYWDWDGQGGYVWREGEYVPEAGHGRLWVYGYWDNPNGVWTWMPAHWS